MMWIAFGRICLALIGAVGIFLTIRSIIDMLFSKPEIDWMQGGKTDKPKNALVASTFLFLGDLGKMFRPTEDLATKLHKSGYVYHSIEEFYARRIINAVYTGILALVLTSLASIFMRVPLIMSIAISAALAYMSFFDPDRKLNKRIKKRCDQILREMSFAMEQIVLIMRVKNDLGPALQSVKNYGMFGRICYNASYGLASGADFEGALKKAMMDYPTFPQLEEFFDLLRSNREGGFRINDALQINAEILRNNLSLEMIKRSASIQNRVTVLASGYIFSATLISSVGALLFSML